MAVDISAGGTIAGSVTEDQITQAPQSLTTSGIFAFTDADLGAPHSITSNLVSVQSSDPAIGSTALGTFTATLEERPELGTGTVRWGFSVNNALVQQLGAGDTLTQTYSINVSANSEFAASLSPGVDQREQRITALAGGGFVVTWTETRDGADFPSIYARVFGADGTPLTNDFRVNTTAPALGAQTPAVAALGGGGFVVVWRSDGDGAGLPGVGGDSSFGVSGQAFDRYGVRVGGEFLANTSVIGNQDAPEVVALDGDRFLVTWRSEEERIDLAPGVTPQIVTYTVPFLQGQIFTMGEYGPAKLLDPDRLEPAEFRLTPLDQPGIEALMPAIEGSTIARLEGGGFVASWTWSEPNAGFVGVLYQVFDAQGRQIGAARYANEADADPASAALFTALGVSALEDGGFVMAWQRGDGTPGLALRVFEADGTARSAILPVGDDAAPVFAATLRIAALEGGGFVAVWQDLADSRIRGQVFAAGGAPVGARFTADSNAPLSFQYDPQVVATKGGGFTLLWTDQNGADADVFVQEFSATGVPDGSGVQANVQGQGTQELGQLVALPGGGVAVTWISQGATGASVLGRVLDGGGAGADHQTVTVTIQGVNDRPTATPLLANPIAIAEVGAGVAATPEVAGNLAFARAIADVDAGETALLRVTSGAGNGQAQADLAFAGPDGEAAITGLYGTLFIQADGDFRYVLDNANPATQALTQGQLVSDVFAYTVTNGAGAENRASSTITVRVRGTNDTPTATAEVAQLALPLPPAMLPGPLERSGTLADNIGDVDAGQAALLQITRAGAGGGAQTALTFDPLSGEAAAQGTYGTLFLKAGGAWRYVFDAADPDSLALGLGAQAQEVFGYTVANGAGAADAANSTISIAISTPASGTVARSTLVPPLAAGEFRTVLGRDDLLTLAPAGSNPVYTVTSAPAGTLLLDGAALGLGASFTQADVDAGRVQYIAGPVAPSTPVATGPAGRVPATGIAFADAVGLAVTDGQGHTGSTTLALPYQGYDTIQTSPAAAGTYAGGVGNDYQAGTGAADSMLGGAGHDLMIGGAGGDTLNGQVGNDRLFGQVGNDTLLGADGSDMLDGGEGGDRLEGAQGNDLLLGGAGADSLLGGVDNDTLDGGAGADSMTGGAGDDVYVVDDAGDVVAEGGPGTDLVLASVTYTLGGAQENLTLTGAGAINGNGNSLNNLLTGNGAANTLVGGAGADTLVGGLGADTLAGGLGGDLFRYGSAAEGRDMIIGYNPAEDTIAVSATGFGGGLVTGGALDPDFFLSGAATPVAGAAAHGQFLYNTTTGALSWDADGAGADGAILLATLANRPAGFGASEIHVF